MMKKLLLALAFLIMGLSPIYAQLYYGPFKADGSNLPPGAVTANYTRNVTLNNTLNVISDINASNNINVKYTLFTHDIVTTGIASDTVSSNAYYGNWLGALIPIANGGTGQSGPYTDGQLLIGNSLDGTLAVNTLTAGDGISITNGNGSIVISSLGSGGGSGNVGTANITNIAYYNGSTSVTGDSNLNWDGSTFVADGAISLIPTMLGAPPMYMPLNNNSVTLFGTYPPNGLPFHEISYTNIGEPLLSEITQGSLLVSANTIDIESNLGTSIQAGGFEFYSDTNTTFFSNTSFGTSVGSHTYLSMTSGNIGLKADTVNITANVNLEGTLSVGTSNPTNSLEVSGNALITGELSINPLMISQIDNTPLNSNGVNFFGTLIDSSNPFYRISYNNDFGPTLLQTCEGQLSITANSLQIHTLASATQIYANEIFLEGTNAVFTDIAGTGTTTAMGNGYFDLTTTSFNISAETNIVGDTIASGNAIITGEVSFNPYMIDPTDAHALNTNGFSLFGNNPLTGNPFYRLSYDGSGGLYNPQLTESCEGNIFVTANNMVMKLQNGFNVNAQPGTFEAFSGYMYLEPTYSFDLTIAGADSIMHMDPTDIGFIADNFSITSNVNINGNLNVGLINSNQIINATSFTSDSIFSNTVTASEVYGGTITSPHFHGAWEGEIIPSVYGGTGYSTYYDGYILVGSSDDNELHQATLTAGSGISITNGNGSITIDSTGTGSGTVNPSDINNVAFYNSSTGVTGNTSLVWNDGNERLGIGTSNPTEALSVSGNAILDGSISLIPTMMGPSPDYDPLNSNSVSLFGTYEPTGLPLFNIHYAATRGEPTVILEDQDYMVISANRLDTNIVGDYQLISNTAVLDASYINLNVDPLNVNAGSLFMTTGNISISTSELDITANADIIGDLFVSGNAIMTGEVSFNPYILGPSPDFTQLNTYGVNFFGPAPDSGNPLLRIAYKYTSKDNVISTYGDSMQCLTPSGSQTYVAKNGLQFIGDVNIDASGASGGSIGGVTIAGRNGVLLQGHGATATSSILIGGTQDIISVSSNVVGVSANIINLQGGVQYNGRLITAAGAVTVNFPDNFIFIKKTVGAATSVSIPDPTTCPFYVINIKDAKGDALLNNITITPVSGTIDGAATAIINTNYASISLISNGIEWSIY